MLTTGINIATVVLEVGSVCDASKHLREAIHGLEMVQARVEVATNSCSAVSDMCSFATLTGGGNTLSSVATVIGSSGQMLDILSSAIQWLKEHSTEEESIDFERVLGLPKIDPFMFYKNLNQKQTPVTQNVVSNFHEFLQTLESSDRETVCKLVFGELTSKRPSGLLGLKQTGQALRNLQDDEKKQIVQIFTDACTRYNLTSSTSQSESSFYLTGYLTATPDSIKDKTSKLHELKIQYLSEHKITPKIQKLIEKPDFPTNLEQKWIWDEDFFSICDPVKLLEEVERVKFEILKQNNNKSLFTEAELEQIEQKMMQSFKTLGNEAAYTARIQYVQDLDKLLKKKFFAKMDLSSVISDKVLKYADFLQETQQTTTGQSKDLDEVKFNKILDFLNTCDPDSRLATEIDAELKKVNNNELDNGLDVCYQKSLQCVYDGLDLSGKTLSFERGFAIKFYEKHLKHSDKREKLMEAFNNELKNFSTISENPTQSVSMATIAILLGLLDPKKDMEIITTYKNLLLEMRQNWQQKMLEMPNNSNLYHAFNLAQNVLEQLTRVNFLNRAERLEPKDKYVKYMSDALGIFSRIANRTGMVAPVAVQFTAPAAAVLGTASSLINRIKFAPDVSSMHKLFVHLQSQEHCENCYKNAYEKLRMTLAKIDLHHVRINGMLPSTALSDHGDANQCREAIFKDLEESRVCIKQAILTLEEKIGEFNVKEDAQPKEILEQADAYEKQIKELLIPVEKQYSQITDHMMAETKKLQAIMNPSDDNDLASFTVRLK